MMMMMRWSSDDGIVSDDDGVQMMMRWSSDERWSDLLRVLCFGRREEEIWRERDV